MFGNWRIKKTTCTEYERICCMSKEERTKEYIKIANERWESCWMIQDSDGWKIEHGKDEIQGCVGSRHFKEFGKIYRIKGLVDASWRDVFDQLVHGDNESPAWNPTVAECRTLEVINENTDIAYNIAREATGGLVSSRDFVNLRHWKEQNGVMVSLGWSVPHPDMPPTKKHVRAENRPSFWTFEADQDDENKCHFALYTRIDLRGWLPHYLVEQAMVGVLANYLVYLRNRMEDLKSGKVSTSDRTKDSCTCSSNCDCFQHENDYNRNDVTNKDNTQEYNQELQHNRDDLYDSESSDKFTNTAENDRDIIDMNKLSITVKA